MMFSIVACSASHFVADARVGAANREKENYHGNEDQISHIPH
jgi:hypothetical protein